MAELRHSYTRVSNFVSLDYYICRKFIAAGAIHFTLINSIDNGVF